MNKAPRCVQETDTTGLGVWLQKCKISKNWNTLLYLHKKSSCYVVLTLVSIQAYTNKSARLVSCLKAYIRINFACWGILLQSCVCSGYMIRTSSNQRHSGTKAFFKARFLMLFALKRRATIDVVTDANVATTADWYKVWIHKSNLISCKWQCTVSVKYLIWSSCVFGFRGTNLI